MELYCQFFKHRPVRNKVRNTDMGYVGRCRRCGSPIRRVRKGEWIKDDSIPGAASDNRSERSS